VKHGARLFAFALLLGTLGSPGSVSAQTAPVVRFAAPAVESWMQAYYADQTGRFEKAGLHVELNIPLSAANILTSVAVGDSDFGIAATTAIAQAVVNGLPLVVIAPAAMSTPQSLVDSLCVAKSSPIQTAKDFEGKTVGVIGLKQFGDLALRAWLTKGGADVSKVRVIQAPFAEMGPALERGTYDAAVMTEPTLAYALKNNSIRCIANPDLAIAPRFMVGGWVVNKAYAAKNPDIVRRVVAVLNETARWANGHRDETALLVSKLTKIDLELIHAEKMRTFYGDRLEPAEIQAPLDAAYAFQFLPRRVTASELLGR
jgi:ABC-type nitrate/sulfonate/bicarbonate transport system substrate-binding protein